MLMAEVCHVHLGVVKKGFGLNMPAEIAVWCLGGQGLKVLSGDMDQFMMITGFQINIVVVSQAVIDYGFVTKGLR